MGSPDLGKYENSQAAERPWTAEAFGTSLCGTRSIGISARGSGRPGFHGPMAEEYRKSKIFAYHESSVRTQSRRTEVGVHATGSLAERVADKTRQPAAGQAIKERIGQHPKSLEAGLQAWPADEVSHAVAEPVAGRVCHAAGPQHAGPLFDGRPLIGVWQHDAANDRVNAFIGKRKRFRTAFADLQAIIAAGFDEGSVDLDARDGVAHPRQFFHQVTGAAADVKDQPARGELGRKELPALLVGRQLFA